MCEPSHHHIGNTQSRYGLQNTGEDGYCKQSPVFTGNAHSKPKSPAKSLTCSALSKPLATTEQTPKGGAYTQRPSVRPRISTANTMERPSVSGRPRLLSDIPEVEFQGPESRSDGAPESSQTQVQASHNLQYKQSPRRPPPTAFNNPSSRSYLHIQQLLPFYCESAMDNPSISAPASLRAERSNIRTPSPTSDRSRDNSLTRSSSATDICLVIPSVVPRSRSSSPIDTPSLSSSPADDRGREPQCNDPRPPVQTGTMNLKLLTCHWWLHTGNCRFSAKDCLYAHHDTGKHAEAPRQVMPGQPAVAGRNADRKLRQAESQLTSLHLNDARNMNPNPNIRMRIHSSNSSLADMTNIFNASTPSTPGLMLRSPHGHNTHNMGQHILPSVIISNSPLQYATTNAAQLENENRFFRTLVEQGGKEKEVMVTTIESLQAENQALRTTNTTITADNARLTEERDVLRGALALLQQQKATGSPLSRSSTPISNLRRAMPGSASWADFGAIGGKRNTT